MSTAEQNMTHDLSALAKYFQLEVDDHIYNIPHGFN